MLQITKKLARKKIIKNHRATIENYWSIKNHQNYYRLVNDIIVSIAENEHKENKNIYSKSVCMGNRKQFLEKLIDHYSPDMKHELFLCDIDPIDTIDRDISKRILQDVIRKMENQNYISFN